jgi:uncharacterized small protein (DUF1192 family)
MSGPDEDAPRKVVKHEVGADLSSLSLDELAERIDLLNAEIRRIEDTIQTKQASADVAASFFKT